MTLFAYGQIIDGQCGIGSLRNFCRATDAAKEKYYLDFEYSRCEPSKFQDAPTRIRHKGGTGLFGTGFVNTDICKEMYDALNSQFKMVFITPIRFNNNSYNKFFYAMWDDKDNTDIAYITPPPWPFDVVKEENAS